jgi:outer membrane protein TolC
VPEFLPPVQLSLPGGSPADAGQPGSSSVQKILEQAHFDANRLMGDTASAVLMKGIQATPINLLDLVGQALQRSHQIQVQRLNVGIETTRITEESGLFDWNLFVDNALSDIRQPADSDIQSATDQRPFQGVLGVGGGVGNGDLEQSSFQNRTGVRKAITTGGEITMNYERSDQQSQDALNVAEQGVDQFVLRVSHDLLRGAGRTTTLNRVIQAEFVSAATYEDGLSEVANLIQQVSDGYWQLLQARGEVLVRRQLLEDGIAVRGELNARKDIDAEPKLLARTLAVVIDRQAQLAASYQRLTEIQNQLLRLVNWAQLDIRHFEVLPIQEVVFETNLMEYDQELQIAFKNRPEVRSTLTRIDAASRELQVSRNQLLPRLAAVIESRFFEIEGNPGEGVSAGLSFEYPLGGNRSAKARNRRAQLELAQSEVQYRDSVAQVTLDVQQAYTQVRAAENAMRLRRMQIDAASQDLAYQVARRRLVPQAGSIPAFDLDQLLNAQQVVADAKITYLIAVADLNAKLLNLLRAKGLLVERAQFQTPG